MSTTIEALRAMLAQRVGRFHTGTATGGSTTTIIDTSGLARFTEDDVLKEALVFIRAAGDAAPEGEARRITGYTATSQTITVGAFSAAVQSGDTYEVYFAPLELEQWDECINAAIRDAWPYAWQLKVDSSVTTVAEQRRYALSLSGLTRAEYVTRIWMEDADGNYPPIGRWFIEDNAGTLTLELDEDPPDADRKIRIEYQIPYPELAAEESTDLPASYLMVAARAEWYALMADAAHGQADASGMLKKMNHWQRIAEGKRVELRALYRRPARKARTLPWHQYVS